MSNTVTKWHRELDVYSQIKSAIIMEGNVFDSYPYPEGDMQGAWMDLSHYLYTFFEERGYKYIIQYDHIDGFTIIDNGQAQKDESLEAFAALIGSEVQNGRISAEFNAEKNGAPHIVRDAVSQTEESVAIIFNLASRYVLSPDRMLPPELKSYSIIQQAIIRAAEVNTQSGRKRNMLIFITNKKNDIPAWMYLNISQITSIFVDYPSASERLTYIGNYTPRRFFDPEIYDLEIPLFHERENELHKIIDRFVARTEGFTYFEMEQLRKLCRTRKTHIAEMSSIIDLYTSSIVDNPWRDE